MLEMMGVSFENNIPLIVTLIIVGVLVLVGIVALVLLFPKIKQKHQQKMQIVTAEKAKKAEEFASNSSFDDNVFAKREAEQNKTAQSKTADESNKVVGIFQHKTGKDTDDDANKKVSIGAGKDKDDLFTILNGNQYDGQPVKQEKPEDKMEKKSVDHILSVMNSQGASKVDNSINGTTEAVEDKKEEK